MVGDEAAAPVRETTIDAAARAMIDDGVAVLRRGGVVAYPTETVYGLGVDAANRAALARLFALKGRRSGSGMSVLVRDLAMASRLLAAEPPAGAIALARAFWPGPLTMVLGAAADLAPQLCGAGGGVGLRCSSDAWACALVEGFAAAITSTSANPSGAEPARSAAQARAYFPRGVDAFVDGGPRRGSEVSSVVEFLHGRAYLRRVGAIDAAALAAVTDLTEEVRG
ncbi:MAG: threonylcarbamoyl-AMP synthase [Deltaproteobacteria bacterium]|nr:threonylcarbamoyl-AMP synthase [Deltaproteobacteria bacterium]